MTRDRNTDDAQDLFSRGHKAFTAGDHREAVECFSRAIRLRPDVAAAYRFRAYAYLELGDRVRALNDLDAAIRLKPDDAQAYADRAAELFTQKSFDQAIADCDQVLKLDPGRAPMYGLRGRCHADRGDTDSALKDYAAGASPTTPRTPPRYLLWRAQLHLDCDNFAAADQDVSEVVSRDPANPEALLHARHRPPAARRFGGRSKRLHRGAQAQARSRLRPPGPRHLPARSKGLRRRRRRLPTAWSSSCPGW